MSTLEPWVRALLRGDSVGLHAALAHTTRCVVGGRETTGAEAAALVPLPALEVDSLTLSHAAHTPTHAVLVLTNKGVRIVAYARREGVVVGRAWVVIEGAARPSTIGGGVAIPSDPRLSQLPPRAAFQLDLHPALSAAHADQLAASLERCAAPGLLRTQAFVVDAASLPTGWAALVRWQGEAADAEGIWRATGAWSVLAMIDGAAIAAFDPPEATAAQPLPFA